MKPASNAQSDSPIESGVGHELNHAVVRGADHRLAVHVNDLVVFPQPPVKVGRPSWYYVTHRHLKYEVVRRECTYSGKMRPHMMMSAHTAEKARSHTSVTYDMIQLKNETGDHSFLTPSQPFLLYYYEGESETQFI